MKEAKEAQNGAEEYSIDDFRSEIEEAIAENSRLEEDDPRFHNDLIGIDTQLLTESDRNLFAMSKKLLGFAEKDPVLVDKGQYKRLYSDFLDQLKKVAEEINETKTDRDMTEAYRDTDEYWSRTFLRSYVINVTTVPTMNMNSELETLEGKK